MAGGQEDLHAADAAMTGGLMAPQIGLPPPQINLADVSPDRLISALEQKAPNVLIACMERMRSLIFKAEACACLTSSQCSLSDCVAQCRFIEIAFQNVF